ncbi:MAG: hypothetical protein D6680_22370, partial [Cyanobacteria bacterium J007]
MGGAFCYLETCSVGDGGGFCCPSRFPGDRPQSKDDLFNNGSGNSPILPKVNRGMKATLRQISYNLIIWL